MVASCWVLLQLLLALLSLLMTPSGGRTLVVAAFPRTNDDNKNNHYHHEYFGNRLLRPIPSLEQQQQQPRIIGGQDAPEGRYPYMVALVDEDGLLVCGGNLIALDVVLTVSQCVGMVRAVVGRQKLDDGNSGDDVAIVQEVDHPFATGIFNYEYKLLKLERPTSATIAQPISILNSDPSLPVVGLSNGVTTMGFGTTSFTDADPFGSTSNTLKEVDITVLSNDECNQIGPPVVEDEIESFAETYRGFITDDMVCAFDVNPNQDFCLGDAGSPLILKGSTATQDVLVGLASWGFDCASSTFPGVYSRISDQFEWIRITTCQLTTTPTTASSNNLPFSCLLLPSSGDNQEARTVSVTVSVTLDDFPGDIGWTLVDGTTWEVVEKVDGETAYQPPEEFQGQTVQMIFSLQEDRVYTFSIRDSFGSGLDPPGTYSIFVVAGDDEDDLVLVDGGDGNFGVVQTTSFQVPPASSATETILPVISPSTGRPTSSPPQQDNINNTPPPTIQPPPPSSPNNSNSPPATPVATASPSTLPPASVPEGESPILSASATPLLTPILTPQPAITIVATPDTTPLLPGPTTETPTQTPTPDPTRPPTANPTLAQTPQPVRLSMPVARDPTLLPTSVSASTSTPTAVNPIPAPLPGHTTEIPTQIPTPSPTRPPTPNPTPAPTVSLSCCTSTSANIIRLDSTLDLVGCADPVCETIVCNVLGDDFCCLVEWDEGCATLAREQCNVCATPIPTVLPTPPPVMPTNSCCEAAIATTMGNVDRGCREMTCQTQICQTDSFCCDIEWDGGCASAAQRECDVCFTPNPTLLPTEEPTPSPVVVVVSQPTPNPSKNSCCIPSMFGEFQGCSDDNCQAEICALNNDPYCCIVEWDVDCANRALEICYVCTNFNTPTPTAPEVIVGAETPPPATLNIPDMEPTLETSDEDLELIPTEFPTSVPSLSPSLAVAIVVLPTGVGSALPTRQPSSEVPSSSSVSHPFETSLSLMILYILLKAVM